MVNVALCGNIALGDGSASDELARCVQAIDVSQPAIHAFSSAFELLEHIGDPHANPLIDLVLFQSGQQGLSAVQIIRDARAAGYKGAILLVEDSRANALEAWRLHVDRYLVSPVSARVFSAEVGALLDRIARLDAESTVLHTREGYRRIAFSSFLFAQTDNHDQVLHMRDGQTARMRCSSQDLFSKLSDDPRFLKLGSSYIANLDHIKALRDNGANVIFVDGSALSVPVRFRKAAQTALLQHARANAPVAREGA